MHSTHPTPDPARSAEALFRAHNEQARVHASAKAWHLTGSRRRRGRPGVAAIPSGAASRRSARRLAPHGRKARALSLLGRARREVPVESTALIATVREFD